MSQKDILVFLIYFIYILCILYIWYILYISHAWTLAISGRGWRPPPGDPRRLPLWDTHSNPYVCVDIACRTRRTSLLSKAARYCTLYDAVPSLLPVCQFPFLPKKIERLTRVRDLHV